VLRDGDQSWLMVCSSIDRTHAVHSYGKPSGHICSQNAVVGGGIEALEKCKVLGIRDLCGFHSFDFLDNNMRMALEDTVLVGMGWSSKVVLLSIDEEASFQIVDAHLDSERGISTNGIKVLRVLELGRRHAILGNDGTHDRWVARALDDLFTIGEGSIDGGAEVDA
jgi:hypothetical protein